MLDSINQFFAQPVSAPRFSFNSVAGGDAAGTFDRFLDIYQWITWPIGILLFAWVIYLLLVWREEWQTDLKILADSIKPDDGLMTGNERWDNIIRLFSSTNQADWRIAIIEADSLLESLTIHIGYQGATLGERLQAMSDAGLPFVQTAWEAHKIRNRIAHEGLNFDLTATLAARTMRQYESVFKSVGYLR